RGCSTSSCCWCCSWCWCCLPLRPPVQCAFISTAATVAGRGSLALLDGAKTAVASIKGEHTPRIILSARSSSDAEHDHANGEERQSHCLNSPTRHAVPNIRAGLYQRPSAGGTAPLEAGGRGRRGRVPRAAQGVVSWPTTSLLRRQKRALMYV